MKEIVYRVTMKTGLSQRVTLDDVQAFLDEASILGIPGGTEIRYTTSAMFIAPYVEWSVGEDESLND